MQIYKMCFFLNMMIHPASTTILSATTHGYPSFNPGISWKFMPNHPVIKVSGKKIVEITVRYYMLLFCLASI